MEWQQLEYFQMLAKIQHMTKAAELLSISQPALSRSIARLEDELGVPLFERRGRSISLNRYGELFVKRVHNIMLEYQAGLSEIQQIIDPNHGEVSLGFLHTLGTNVVPDVIRHFREEHENIHFSLKQNHTHLQLLALQNGDLDLCLLAEMDVEKPIQWRELWRENLLAIVPSDHPFASKSSITLAELATESFVLLKKGYALRIQIDELFTENNVTPKITFEGDEVATVAGFVAAGLGVSLLPEGDDMNHSKVTSIPLEDVTAERVIGMAWSEGRYLSPAAKKFQQFIFDYFQDQ
ncbi:LysR family transcriptional regulator [Kurthia sibirica]|uniref:LysR family transcriptional regulator n=1 Tax=Kurthia sibirica TaxID=202750 RepID=A0A2U3ARE1_9BACL|nr:LysR family transcriptional regulator [Kurthia sibirica]PWI27025.1 LysR family transcriptional regulator [Kurthia sibirica]GEK35323.1 putative HTH-type transcriptional regulator YybE [Kurthia sibirica]